MFSQPVRAILLLFICALAFAPLGLAGAAQTPPVTMTAQVGLDGMAEAGSWVPIRVDVANTGPDLKAQIVLSEAGAAKSDMPRYTRSIDLPHQSHKQFFVYWWADSATTIKAQVVAGNRVLTQQPIDIRPFDADSQLIAVLSPAAVNLSWLPVIRPPVRAQRVAQLGVEDIPPLSDALASLDALIVLDADTGQLVQPQRDALRQWVEGGGTLIVTGGSHWQKSTAGLADLLPVTVSDARTLDRLDEIGGSLAAGPVLVAHGVLREGIASLAQDAVPLVARRDVGQGSVYFIAWDPASEPMASWTGSSALWASLLGRAITPQPTAGIISLMDTSDLLDSLPEGRLPPAWQICGFLLLYMLILGPLNYLALRRFKRRELAWLTVPVISLAFSACAYLIGLQTRGSWVTLHRMVVVQGQAGQTQGQADVWLGMRSPRRATYDVQISPNPTLRDGPVLVQPLDKSSADSNIPVIEQGSPVTLRGVKIDTGSLKSFAASLPAPLPRISADLVLDVGYGTANLSGEIRNESNVDLQDAVVLVGSAGQPVGTFKAGQVISMSWSLKDSTWYGGSSTRITSGQPGDLAYMILGSSATTTPTDLGTRRKSMLNTLLLSGHQHAPLVGIYLAGWASRAPLTTVVRGGTPREVDDVFYLIRLPYRTQPIPSGSFMLASGLSNSQMTRSYGGLPGLPANLRSNQPMPFHLSPWPQVAIGRVTTITLQLDDYSGTTINEVYNRRTGQWQTISTIPSYGKLVLPDPEGDYVGLDGELDVRITSPGSPLKMYKVEATLEGIR